MRNSFIPVNTPLLDGNERKYLNECIDTGWISSEGPFVRKFEENMAARVGRKYGVAVANGTAALDLAVESLGLKPGDEIIMPSFTIISCISQIIRLGIKPVLVDSDTDTWNMNTKEISRLVTKKTKAIMIVHIYGLPADVDPILNIAKEHDLWVIEDAAEMHGQTYKDRPCGSIGDVSIFSFYPNKLITTGEGGMLLTDNAELAESFKSLRNLCFEEKRRFVHHRLGWNVRMTNLQAAIGVAQLERLDQFVEKKRRMGQLYTQELDELKNFIQVPLPETAYAKNLYWVYGILLRDSVSMGPDEVTKILAEKGIGTRPFFYPMHLQPVLREANLFPNLSLPVSERLSSRGFYIPSGLGLTEEEILYVSKTLKEILK